MRTAAVPDAGAAGAAGRQVRLALFATVVVGLSVSLQSRINAGLAVRLVDGGETPAAAGFHTALISFGTGLAVLTAAVLALGRMRAALRAIAAAVADRRLRPWQLLGGAAGAWLVATQGLTVPTLGVALFLVAVVAGQAFGSLGVDAAGLGPAGRVRLNGSRIAGAALALAAVVVTVWPRLGTSSDGSAALLLGALAVSAGLGTAVQQALNAHVSVAGGWAPAAAVVNFVVGASILGAAVMIGIWMVDWTLAPLPGPLWLYLGGPIGVAFIAVAAWVVPIVGVLRFALVAINGQLIGGALLDLVAPGPGVTVGWSLAAGVALTMVAVAITNRT